MFWVSLAAFLFGSVMCWTNGLRRVVLVFWGLWLTGFFAIPILLDQGWPFLALQAVLAIVLLLRWKIYDVMP